MITSGNYHLLFDFYVILKYFLLYTFVMSVLIFPSLRLEVYYIYYFLLFIFLHFIWIIQVFPEKFLLFVDLNKKFRWRRLVIRKNNDFCHTNFRTRKKYLDRFFHQKLYSYFMHENGWMSYELYLFFIIYVMIVHNHIQ